MLSIVLAVILGIAFTAVALQNPGVVPVNFFGVSFGLPLYVFAAFSFLAGTFITLLFSLFDRTSFGLELHDKDSRIREATKANQNLQAQMQRLAAENAEIRHNLNEAQALLRREKVETTKAGIKNFVDRVKHSFVPRSSRSLS